MGVDVGPGNAVMEQARASVPVVMSSAMQALGGSKALYLGHMIWTATGGLKSRMCLVVGAGSRYGITWFSTQIMFGVTMQST